MTFPQLQYMQLIGFGGGGNRGYEDNEHAFISSPLCTYTYDWICILLRKVRGDGNKQVGVHISSKIKAIHPYHQS